MRSVKQFVKLTQRKKRLESQLAKVKEQLSALEQKLLEEFERKGLQSIHTDTGETVYLRRQLWASLRSDADVSTVLGILQSTGLEYLLSIHSSKLSALAREENIPPELEPYVNITERYSIVAKGVSINE